MGKVRNIKVMSREEKTEALESTKNEIEEAAINYQVISAIKLDELIARANHWIIFKYYQPIGGATYSDELGIWTQTLIKRTKDC